jgi:predicted Zn-dependent protease
MAKAVELYDRVADRWLMNADAPTVMNRNNLAGLYAADQQYDRALQVYADALARAPSSLDARIGYGMMLQTLHRPDEALTQYQEAMKQHPDDPVPYVRVATLLLEQMKFNDAIGLLRAGLARNRDSVETLSTLARTLATCPDASLRNPAEAHALAGEAVMRSEGRDPVAISALAAATAENGDLQKAIMLVNEAIRIAGGAGMTEMAVSFDAERQVYQSGMTLSQVQAQPSKAGTQP